MSGLPLQNVQIRLAEPYDITRLNKLATTAIRKLGRHAYSRGQIQCITRQISTVEIDLVHRRSLYIAELAGRIVGCGGLSDQSRLVPPNASITPPKYEHARPGAASLRSFFVEPSLSGQGITDLVFERCLSDAARFGYDRIELISSLLAVNTFRRFGFGQETRVVMSLPDGARIESIHMTRSVPSLLLE